MKQTDLQNLPKDPALEANSRSNNKESEMETEEDAIRGEALRRLQVRRLFQKQPGQTKT
jgi:hypothetical protein